MPAWSPYLLLTVSCWGMYGVFLHLGATGMSDPTHGRMKAFVFVGLAYFLVAFLAPLALLWVRGASMTFDGSGAAWSLVAGTVGAIGAFGVLLAFGAGGKPAVVMSCVFAGAPIVNAIVSTTRAGQWGEVSWPFLVGILLAATGGGLVVYFKPPPPHAALVHAEPAADAER